MAESRKNTAIARLAAYLLLVCCAPILGFTAVLDIGYAVTGHLIMAFLWGFIFGPILMAGVIWLASK